MLPDIETTGGDWRYAPDSAGKTNDHETYLHFGGLLICCRIIRRKDVHEISSFKSNITLKIVDCAKSPLEMPCMR